jgi:hypothetical protein
MHTSQKLWAEARFIQLIRVSRNIALSLPALPFACNNDIETLDRYWCKNIQATRRLSRRGLPYPLRTPAGASTVTRLADFSQPSSSVTSSSNNISISC